MDNSKKSGLGAVSTLLVLGTVALLKYCAQYDKPSIVPMPTGSPSEPLFKRYEQKSDISTEAIMRSQIAFLKQNAPALERAILNLKSRVPPASYSDVYVRWQKHNQQLFQEAFNSQHDQQVVNGLTREQQTIQEKIRSLEATYGHSGGDTSDNR